MQWRILINTMEVMKKVVQTLNALPHWQSSFSCFVI